MYLTIFEIELRTAFRCTVISHVITEKSKEALTIIRVNPRLLNGKHLESVAFIACLAHRCSLYLY